MKNTTARLKSVTLILGLIAMTLPSCVVPPPPGPGPVRPVAVRRGPVVVRPALRPVVRPGPIARRW